MYTDAQYAQGMLDVGADGYLLKQSAAHELPAAVHAVARGEITLSPTVSSWLVRQLRRRGEQQPRIESLTERERQVVSLLAQGSTSKEIALQLGLSTKTVENHRARILEKLQVTNTAAAISLAHQQGLLVLDDQK